MQNEMEFEIASDAEANRIIMELYDRGYGLAVFIVESVLGSQVSRTEVEDLVQEGYLRMILHVEKLIGQNDKEKLSYLRRTMRNVALDEGRRRSQGRIAFSLDDESYVDAIASADLTAEERCIMEADLAEKKRCLAEALDMLGERDRQILIEKYKNGLSDAEIAQKLGIKARNVRVYLSRARRKAAMNYGEVAHGGKHKNEPKHNGSLSAGGRTGEKTEAKGL